MTEVCEAEFPEASPNVDRLADFNDSLSWGCITRADLGADTAADGHRRDDRPLPAPPLTAPRGHAQIDILRLWCAVTMEGVSEARESLRR